MIAMSRKNGDLEMLFCQKVEHAGNMSRVAINFRVKTLTEGRNLLFFIKSIT